MTLKTKYCRDCGEEIIFRARPANDNVEAGCTNPPPKVERLPAKGKRRAYPVHVNGPCAMPYGQYRLSL